MPSLTIITAAAEQRSKEKQQQGTTPMDIFCSYSKGFRFLDFNFKPWLDNLNTLLMEWITKVRRTVTKKDKRSVKLKQNSLSSPELLARWMLLMSDVLSCPAFSPLSAWGPGPGTDWAPHNILSPDKRESLILGLPPPLPRHNNSEHPAMHSGPENRGWGPAL